MIRQRTRNWWLFLYLPLIAILLGAVIGLIIERAVLGALVYGFIGLGFYVFAGVLILVFQSFMRDPLQFLLDLGFSCCQQSSVLTLGVVGMVSGWLIWHTFLVGILTGGVVALMVMVGFAALALAQSGTSKAAST